MAHAEGFRAAFRKLSTMLPETLLDDAMNLLHWKVGEAIYDRIPADARGALFPIQDFRVVPAMHKATAFTVRVRALDRTPTRGRVAYFSPKRPRVQLPRCLLYRCVFRTCYGTRLRQGS